MFPSEVQKRCPDFGQIEEKQKNMTAKHNINNAPENALAVKLSK